MNAIHRFKSILWLTTLVTFYSLWTSPNAEAQSSAFVGPANKYVQLVDGGTIQFRIPRPDSGLKAELKRVFPSPEELGSIRSDDEETFLSIIDRGFEESLTISYVVEERALTNDRLHDEDEFSILITGDTSGFIDTELEWNGEEPPRRLTGKLRIGDGGLLRIVNGASVEGVDSAFTFFPSTFRGIEVAQGGQLIVEKADLKNLRIDAPPQSPHPDSPPIKITNSQIRGINLTSSHTVFLKGNDDLALDGDTSRSFYDIHVDSDVTETDSSSYELSGNALHNAALNFTFDPSKTVINSIDFLAKENAFHRLRVAPKATDPVEIKIEKNSVTPFGVAPGGIEVVPSSSDFEITANSIFDPSAPNPLGYEIIVGSPPDLGAGSGNVNRIITGNTFVSRLILKPGPGEGLVRAFNNTLNTNEDNTQSAVLVQSIDNRIHGNTITALARNRELQDRAGIEINHPSGDPLRGNVISGNTISNFPHGIMIAGADSGVIRGNTLFGNRVNLAIGGFEGSNSNAFAVRNALIVDNSFGTPIEANVIFRNACRSDGLCDIDFNFEELMPAQDGNIAGHAHFGGNYWATYTGKDADSNGFIDAPFTIDSLLGHVDQFPIFGPIIVNDFRDAGDADLNDGVADADLSQSGLQTTLRAAMEHALQGGGPTAIHIESRSNRTRVISLSSPLPTISKPLIIKNIGNEVRVDGLNLGPDASGFVIKSENVTLDGLTITRFGRDGVDISLFRPSVDGLVKIVNCTIGTTLDCEPDLGNGRHAIFIFSSTQIQIEKNTLSGNGEDGIHLFGFGDVPDAREPRQEIVEEGDPGVASGRVGGVRIYNNSIGLAPLIVLRDRNFGKIMPNGGHGISAVNASQLIIGNGPPEGTTNDSRGNFIAANRGAGIMLEGSDEAKIVANEIGRAEEGQGNGSMGIRVVDSRNLTIGEEGNGLSNSIAGNGQAGISISGSRSEGVTYFANNYIRNQGPPVLLNPISPDDLPNGNLPAPTTLLATLANGEANTLNYGCTVTAKNPVSVAVFGFNNCPESTPANELEMTFLKSVPVSPDDTEAFFQVPWDSEKFAAIVSTVTDATGNTSGFSTCLDGIPTITGESNPPTISNDPPVFVNLEINDSDSGFELDEPDPNTAVFAFQIEDDTTPPEEIKLTTEATRQEEVFERLEFIREGNFKALILAPKLNATGKSDVKIIAEDSQGAQSEHSVIFDADEALAPTVSITLRPDGQIEIRRIGIGRLQVAESIDGPFQDLATSAPNRLRQATVRLLENQGKNLFFRGFIGP